MSTLPSRHESGPVVVGVDGSPGSGLAVAYAAQYAAMRRLPLRVAHGAGIPVVTDFVIDLDEARRGLHEHGDRVVADAVRLAHEHAPQLDTSTLVELDDPRALLLREAAGASAVVLGSRGHGTVASLLLGSVGVAVTAHATAPVVVVRPEPETTDDGRPIVVGVDGTPASAGAVETAFDLATWQRRPVQILHALGDPLTFPYYAALTDEQVHEIRTDAELRVAESVAGYAERYPDVSSHLSIVLDSPAHALREVSRSAQAVVVGSRGRGPVARRLLGSVSRSVVERAHCTVAVVPPIDVPTG